MKTVLLDYHHPQLLKSLEILFEKRLKMRVLLPLGKEWFEQGYYNYYGNPQQSLEFLNYPDHIQGVTLAEAKHMKIDFVASTVPLTEDCYIKFIHDHQPQAKHIVILGNVGYIPKHHNLMSSTNFGGYEGQNVVKFHQEFDLNLFDMPDQTPKKQVSSYMHFDHIYHDFPLFCELKSLMNDFEFRSYGYECQDGLLPTDRSVACSMAESSFIWHVKHVGEGYGHVVHKAARMGKPMIFRSSYMRGSLAEKFMIHGETGIDLDASSTAQEIAHDIRRFSSPSELTRMGNNLRYTFDTHINFDKEASDVRDFLERCV